jgi:D-tyrosyl-tRNA(Tyr) deacylase
LLRIEEKQILRVARDDSRRPVFTASGFCAAQTQELNLWIASDRVEFRHRRNVLRAVIQRVSRASVTVEGRVAGDIGSGILVLLGVGRSDNLESAAYLAEKIANLRIFSDEAGKMNLSLLDVGGSALVVSQFTHYGDTRGGRRPSYIQAALSDEAARLYEGFIGLLRSAGITVATGVFQAYMQVELVNDGPVTILLDSEKKI